MDLDDIILWDEQNQKWADRMNDHFCAKSFTRPGHWEVRARYGFADGDRTKFFESEEEAMGFFRLFLAVKYTR